MPPMSKRGSGVLVIVMAVVAGVGCKKDEGGTGKKNQNEDRGGGGGGRENRKPTPPQQATGTPRPQPNLTVTVDGKAVAMQSAMIWNKADGSLEVAVSSHAVTCDDVTGSMRTILDGEEYFTARIVKKLQNDGRFVWKTSWVSYSASTRAGDLGLAELTGDVSAGQPKTLKLDFTQESAAFRGEAKKRIDVEGTVDAIGCATPTEDRSITVEPRPPAQAGTIEIAGQKLPIAGAAFQQLGGEEREVVLSTGAVTCDGWVHAENGELGVSLHYRDATDDVWQGDLTGAWIEGQIATQIWDGGRLVATPTRAPAGATTVELTLSGAADINGFPVKLDGKVTAQVCPPGK